MIKSPRSALLALTILPFLASQALPLEPIELSLTNRALLQDLVGVWEGSWFSDNGYSDSFRLTIKSANETGYIMGSRMYVTQSYGANDVHTEGYILDGEMHLDDERGKNVWIKLKLFRDEETGQLSLNGRYSTVGGGTVYLGDISTKKISR